jgi:hypothetical protein
VSRSWTERAKAKLRLPRAASAGVAIGRDYVGFACLETKKGQHRMRVFEEKLETELFQGAPTPQAAKSLIRALGKAGSVLAERYLPLHVSLPDALVRCTVLELDQLPDSRTAQLELVGFRFVRQGLEGAQVHACQQFGRDGEKQLVLGLATDAGWHALVGEALERAGIAAWTVNGNACRQFNLFHDRLAGASGALIALAPDAWSLWLWDGQGRTRYGRGRWRTGGDDHDDIALEVERSILAYVQGDSARTVAKVYLVAGAESNLLADKLNVRLREPCVGLSLDDLEIAMPLQQNSNEYPKTAALSIAAALEQ